MNNLTANIVDGKLVIELPLNDPLIPSKSQKTLVVASTHGNQISNAVIDGKQIIIGVNAYVYPN